MTVAFADRTRAPDDGSLTRVLGTAKSLWDALIGHVDALPDGVAREWKFYGPKYGWQMKVAAKKRALLYLVPHENSFLAGLALNDDAVAALRAQKIPAPLLHEIEASARYPEGRPARVEVKSARDVAIVKQLLAAKLNASSKAVAPKPRTIAAASGRTIDDYLADVGSEQRAALEKIREAIRAAAPDAEECFSYGLPAFRLNGQLIAGFAATAKHCAYYPMSGSTIATLKKDLAGFETSKGAIRFQPGTPLSAALVRKLVKTRLAEGAVSKPAKGTKAARRPARVKAR